MTRKKNIFYNLINSEDATTELLCNLLQFKTFRELFLSIFLKKEEIMEIDFDDIDTQLYLMNEKYKPDLVISNEKIEIIYEIKTSLQTGLTKNQPMGYLKYLKTIKDKKKWLILLIPKGYRYEKEWINTTEESLKNYSDKDINTDILYWEDILEKIKENEIDRINVYFKDFVEILEDFYIVKPINFIDSEVTLMFTKTVADIITKLYETVDLVEKYNIKNVKKIIKKTNTIEYGLYFKNDEGKEILYFGVWYDFWKTHKKPICYGVYKDYSKEVISKFIKYHKDKIIEHDDWIMSYISKEEFNKENAADAICKLVEQVLAYVL